MSAAPGQPQGWTTGEWELGPHFRLRRAIAGPDWPTVTDHTAQVYIVGTEWEDGITAPPEVHVHGMFGGGLNSDQARELGSALLEAAAAVDRWAESPREAAALEANERRSLLAVTIERLVGADSVAPQ